MFETVLEQVAEISTGLLASICITVGAIVSVLAVRREQQFHKIRPHGGTQFVASALQTTILSLILITAGIGIIAAFRNDVPYELSLGLPLLFGFFAVSLAMGQLAPRNTFSWRRFWSIVVVPILSTVIPLGALVVKRLPREVETLL